MINHFLPLFINLLLFAIKPIDWIPKTGLDLSPKNGTGKNPLGKPKPKPSLNYASFLSPCVKYIVLPNTEYPSALLIIYKYWGLLSVLHVLFDIFVVLITLNELLGPIYTTTATVLHPIIANPFDPTNVITEGRLLFTIANLKLPWETLAINEGFIGVFERLY